MPRPPPARHDRGARAHGCLGRRDVGTGRRRLAAQPAARKRPVHLRSAGGRFAPAAAREQVNTNTAAWLEEMARAAWPGVAVTPARFDWDCLMASAGTVGQGPARTTASSGQPRRQRALRPLGARQYGGTPEAGFETSLQPLFGGRLDLERRQCGLRRGRGDVGHAGGPSSSRRPALHDAERPRLA